MGTTCEPRFVAAGTECRAASCSSGVATAAAVCSGSAAECPSATIQNCAPYVCGASACATTCSGPSDCAAGAICVAGRCAAPLELGDECSDSGACGSGHCADGVCCEGACTGQCEACSAAGQCEPVSGAPRGGRASCADDGAGCGGVCDGARRDVCSYPTDVCRAGSCAGGVATLEERCDGRGGCPAPRTQACSPFTCGPSECDGDCALDEDCESGSFCSAGVCVPAREVGEECTRAAECGARPCADGRCCDRACTGSCEACDRAGAEGSCGPITGSPRPGRETCASDGSSCGGTCDGTRSDCSYSTDVCAPASCAGDTQTSEGRCDGAGACEEGISVDCGLYTCGAAECLSACEDTDDCRAGSQCVGTSCVSRSDAGIMDDAGTSSDAGAIDAGVADDAGTDPGTSDGCGCRTARGGGDGLWLALAALLFVRRRRKGAIHDAA
jgi:hypothetical protein